MPKQIITTTDGKQWQKGMNGRYEPYTPAPRRLNMQETVLEALYDTDLRMSELEAILLNNAGKEHSIKSTLTQMRAKGHIAFRKSVQRRIEDQCVVICPEGERLEETRRAASLIMPPGVRFVPSRVNPNYRGNHAGVDKEWAVNVLRSNGPLTRDQMFVLAKEQGFSNFGALRLTLGNLLESREAILREDDCYVLIDNGG